MNALAIDTETTGPYLHHGCQPFMVSSADEDGNIYLWDFPVDPHSREVKYDASTVRNLQATLASYDHWVFHNAVFDLNALAAIPWNEAGCTFQQHLSSDLEIDDTMLMAHCHNSLDRLGLKGLAFQYIDYPEDDEQELDKTVTRARRIAKLLGWSYADETISSLRPLKQKKGKCDFWLPAAVAKQGHSSLIPETRRHFAEVCATYAKGDAIRTIGLYIYFHSILTARDDWQYYLRNRESILPTYRMQAQGFHLKMHRVPVILKRLASLKQETTSGLRKLSTAKLNPRSPIHLRAALFETLGLDPQSFTKTGQPSTDKEAIRDILSFPEINAKQETFCKRLLTYRRINTAESYLESYRRHEVRSYLYPNLNICGTSTTRYACKDPNTQNISKQDNDDEAYDLTAPVNLRDAFGPPTGKLWICIDYAQLQLRIFAHACEDAFLIDSFAQGLDIHDTVAREVFRTDSPTSLQRRAAKAINFGVIFGAGRNRIERMSGIDGSYDLFRSRFPLVSGYLRRCEVQARKYGYIRTLGGYPLRVPRKTAYKACNFVVQGTEGELVKRAINACDAWCYHRASSDYISMVPIMTIHDEIIFETTTKMTTTQLRKNSAHLSNLEFIMSLMNLAAAEVGVSTEVDVKITDTTWSEAKPFCLTASATK